MKRRFEVQQPSEEVVEEVREALAVEPLPALEGSFISWLPYVQFRNCETAMIDRTITLLGAHAAAGCPESAWALTKALEVQDWLAKREAKTRALIEAEAQAGAAEPPTPLHHALDLDEGRPG